MKYITPNVPNIKITTSEDKEILIDYVYEMEMITLNEKALILIEVPLSDTSMDELTHTDKYKMNLDFKIMDLMCNDLVSKALDFKDMELKLKIDTYQTGCAERKIYAFYNNEGEAIYDVIDTILNNKYCQSKNNIDNDLYFAKVESNAIIPSKRDEDAGYDIYTCETETIFIPPCSTRMIDTGIAIACSNSYFPKFFDKGGMGSKGVIVGAGVGDSGYRDKYFIPLINTNKDFCLVITNQKDEEIKASNYFDTKINKFTYIEDIQKADDEYMNECKCNPDEWIGIRFYQKESCIIKPSNKAITQFVMIPVPKMNVKEISYEELKNMKSERGLGKMGSSGK